MSRSNLFASATLAMTLAAGTSFAAGTLVPSHAPMTGVELSFSAAPTVGTPREQARPDLRTSDYPVARRETRPASRDAASSDLQVLPPIMQTRSDIAPATGTGSAPVASRDGRLKLNSYWSIGAFR